MTPELYQRIQALMQSALELESDERASFLDEACAGDESLRRQVEALLISHERASSFLESPAVEFAAPLISDPQHKMPAGESIGPYQVISQLGSGGMGTVYLAERADFRHRVALKIIKRGMDSDEIVRRFRRERQVLATLNHPNISRLLDGGTTQEGTPFFVMEYIEGERITEVCDKQKLGIEERLALFSKVCSAVSYAHQHLVVHRDIKPSNILVGPDGEPKLLDFGISKLLAPDALETTVEQTATGIRLMTPEYASPEQLRGEKITMASDIYSLGVLLYELLSGHRPFRFKNRSAIDVLQIASEQEPSAPSRAVLTTEVAETEDDTDKTLSPEGVAGSRGERPRGLCRRLSGDLDNITLRALRKEPARRYESVDQFAQDIGRHLAGLPVSARPMNVGYRVVKFVRRNRTSTALTAILFLFVAAIAASWGYFLWRSPHDKKAPQIVSTTSSRTIAVLPLKNLSTEKGDEFLSIGLTDALITRLGNIRALAVRPTSTVLSFTADNGLTAQQVGEKLKVENILEGTIERVAEKLRVSLRLIKTKDGSVVWTGTFSEDPSAGFKIQGSISQRVADAMQIQMAGDEREKLARGETANPEAFRLYLKARYFWSKRTPDDLRRAVDLFEQSARLDPRFAQAFAGIASCYTLLGGSDFSAISPAEGAAKARAAASKAIDLDPNLAEPQAVLGSVEMNYDWNAVAGEQSFRRAIEINPNNPTAHQWLGWCLIAGSRFTEAEAEFRLARELDPTSLIIANDSCEPAFFAGDYEAAIRQLKQVLETDKNFAGAHVALWRALHEAGRYDEARAEIDAVEALVGRDIPILLMARGRTLAMSGRPDEARKILSSLSERKQKGEYISPLYIAMIAAELDDRDATFLWLDEAFAERSDYLVYLPIAPEFNRLHNDPRFQHLVRRVGLQG